MRVFDAAEKLSFAASKFGAIGVVGHDGGDAVKPTRVDRQ